MDRVIEFLTSHVNKDDCVVLACSGGPDSMCLFDLVNKYLIDTKIIIVCVNHNVRNEALDELNYVKNCALNNNYIFEELTIEHNDNYTEDDFRNIRYDFFRAIIKKYNANILLTAHHGDDLIETILMRIVRGSDLNGYAGIKTFIDKGSYRVLRPLMFVNKNQILKYNEENKIKYFNDSSNDLDTYTRNRYRHHVLPFLYAEDEHVNDKFLRFSNEILKNEEFINSVIERYESDIFLNNKIIVDKFNKLDLFVRERIIKRLLAKIYKEKLYFVSDKTVNNIINMISNNVGNTKINIPNGYVAMINYGYFYIINSNEKSSDVYKFIDGLNLDNGYSFKILSECSEKSNYVIRLNKNDIKLPLFIRYRKDGDFISIKGTNGSKKIKDVFIDSKIDVDKRDFIPLLVDSSDTVLWVPGIKKSKFDREINEMYDIIIKYVKEDGYE